MNEDTALLGGRYRVLGTLGEGGMAIVFRCRDETLRTEWAVKQFTPPAGNAAVDLIEQFRLEAHLLARLRHDGLPRVIDFFEESGCFYLVMDLIEGVSMRQRLDVPVAREQAVRWLVAILDVLEYLHGQQPPILFRDLSPSNIMICADDRLRLIDFGLARLLEPQGKTRPALRGYGSSGYAPAEQYGHASTDVRSDLYGVAAVAYHLFSGHPPPDAVAVLVGQETVPPLDLSPLLRTWVMRGLQSQAERRFASAVDMREKLLAAVQSLEPRMADCEPFLQRLWQQMEKWRWKRLPPAGGVTAAFAGPLGLRRQETLIWCVPTLGEKEMRALLAQARAVTRSRRGVVPTRYFVVLAANRIPNPVDIADMAKQASDRAAVVVAVDCSRGRVVDAHVGPAFSDTNNLADFLLNLRIAAQPSGSGG